MHKEKVENYRGEIIEVEVISEEEADHPETSP